MVVGDCAVVVSYDLHTTREALRHQNHRGQDSTGIAALNGDKIDIVKWLGLAEDFRFNDLRDILGDNRKLFIGHKKYLTFGDMSLHTAHPLYFGETAREEYRDSHMIIRGADIAVVHNGELVNYDNIKQEIESRGFHLPNNCDSQAVPYLWHTYGRAVERLMRRIEPSYFAALMDKDGVTVIADQFKNRPGWFGFDSSGRPLVASEDCAIIKLGGRPDREIKAGESVFLSRDGDYEFRQVLPSEPHPCIFELIYLSRAEINKDDPEAEVSSTFSGVNVKGARTSWGRSLAQQFAFLKEPPYSADFVTYTPHSPYHAAKAFAEKIGLPFEEVMYKVSEQGHRRSFMAREADRERMIWDALFLLPEYKEVLRGKNVIVKDDSHVRSTVLPRVLYLLKVIGGAERVYALNYSPVIGGSENGRKYYCRFGVAMPAHDSFAAGRYGRDPENIRRHVGPNLSDVLLRHPEYALRDDVDPTKHYELDYLGHLDAQRMLQTVGLPNACWECMGGPALPVGEYRNGKMLEVAS